MLVSNVHEQVLGGKKLFMLSSQHPLKNVVLEFKNMYSSGQRDCGFSE